MGPSNVINNGQAPELAGYETVHTVTDYWDGPREGVANYKGLPHYYKCLFDEQKDEWSDIFLVKSIDSETFALALEAWDIWLRWETAFRAGRTGKESHPALPEDHDRQTEISKLLVDRLQVDPHKDLKLEGEFEPLTRSVEGKQIIPSEVKWRVHWHVVEPA